MFGLLADVINVTADVAKIVTAPVRVGVSVVGAVVKPIAGLAEEVVDEVKSVTKKGF